MADLLSTVYLRVLLPTVDPSFTWRPNVGYWLIQRLQLIAGNVTVDDLDGLQHIIHDALHLTSQEQRAVSKLIGGAGLSGGRQHELLIPLQLFFTRQGGQGLPLVAMTKSKLQLNVTLAPLASLLWQGSNSPVTANYSLDSSATLTVETVTLNGDERTSFMTSPVQLLIEQTLTQQYQTCVVTNNHDVLCKPDMQVDLSFMQGSVKQVLLVFVDAVGNFVPALNVCSLFVNNVQQGDARVGDYFLLPSSYSHCVSSSTAPVYSINFALQTSFLQPSGVLDMNQVTSCFLQINLGITDPLTLHVYSISYNTLNFQNGVVSS